MSSDVTISQVMAFITREKRSSYEDWCLPRGIDCEDMRQAVHQYRLLYGSKSKRSSVDDKAKVNARLLNPCVDKPHFINGFQVTFTEINILEFMASQGVNLDYWCRMRKYDALCFQIAVNRYAKAMGTKA